MKYTIILLIGLISLSIYSCSDDDDSPQDESIFYWNQTKCADPWNTGENSTNEETEIAVKAYLENEEISVQSIQFDNKSPLATDCESCGCGTGQRIIVDVEDSDISKMKDWNFINENKINVAQQHIKTMLPLKPNRKSWLVCFV